MLDQQPLPTEVFGQLRHRRGFSGPGGAVQLLHAWIGGCEAVEVEGRQQWMEEALPRERRQVMEGLRHCARPQLCAGLTVGSSQQHLLLLLPAWPLPVHCTQLSAGSVCARSLYVM